MREAILLLLRQSTIEELESMLKDKAFIATLNEKYQKQFEYDVRFVLLEKAGGALL